MKNPRIATQSRQSLETRFEDMRPVARFDPPARGWIKAIGEALGMSSAQLVKRLRVKQPTVAALEQSELIGAIQLATLRRIAEAMNCTLVYALVPRDPPRNHHSRAGAQSGEAAPAIGRAFHVA